MPRNASTTSNAGIEVYEYVTGSRLRRVTLDGVETQRFEYDENGRVSRIVRDGLEQRLHWASRCDCLVPSSLFRGMNRYASRRTDSACERA